MLLCPFTWIFSLFKFFIYVFQHNVCYYFDNQLLTQPDSLLFYCCPILKFKYLRRVFVYVFSFVLWLNFPLFLLPPNTLPYCRISLNIFLAVFPRISSPIWQQPAGCAGRSYKIQIWIMPTDDRKQTTRREPSCVSVSNDENCLAGATDTGTVMPL